MITLWTPTAKQIASSQMHGFCKHIASSFGLASDSYQTLHQWSIDHREQFWREVWDYCELIGEGSLTPTLLDGERMPGARWFPELRLNFAENLLRRRDDADAIVFYGEDQTRRTLSYKQLYQQVSRIRQALQAAGIGKGDRVAAYLPNQPEAVSAMLAAVSLGTIWTSCSPDFGVDGVIDRFGQVEPRILFVADHYYYAGKRHSYLDKVADVRGQLPTLEQVVVIPYGDILDELPADIGMRGLDDFIVAFTPREINFTRYAFDHPLYIMFSSGTTGKPKCIVHGAGGSLIQHAKEHALHADIRHGDRVFYFTTLGWMMWNWLVSALARGATLLLYDGSPFHPGPGALFDFAQAEDMTLFGTSAKYIDALSKAGFSAKRRYELPVLRTICSTGSPLAPEAFEYVYREIKDDVCLSSIAGGTDLLSCFALGNPTLPVYTGELQCLGLGMAVEVWDQAGKKLTDDKGELVCTLPFPSMPVGFWNDPDGRRYHDAYFARFDNIWHHGDFVSMTPHSGMVFYGRSDAVLNPGGVRIGTAEIYRQAEKVDEVEEALVIGQQWQHDVRVVLFVKLREGASLDDELAQNIRLAIRRETTPRHVPAKVLQVDAIPRTKSGKIVELAVRDVVHGRAVENLHALANPEALEQFRDRPELSR